MERKFLTVNKLNISRVYFGQLLFFLCKSQISRKIDLTVDKNTLD